MAEIITEADLPAGVTTAIDPAQLTLILAGANARAVRVAPCLVAPSTTAWQPTTPYVVGDRVMLAGGEFLEATIEGTSGGVEPTAPALGSTVTDGTVTWKRIAPTEEQLAEAKLILLGAITRWAEAGSGAYSQQQAGPFMVSTDTRQRTGYNLWPSEIKELQALCAAGKSGAFSVDTAPSGSFHQPWCSLAFGTDWCSCGSDLTGSMPLYEY